MCANKLSRRTEVDKLASNLIVTEFGAECSFVRLLRLGLGIISRWRNAAVCILAAAMALTLGPGSELRLRWSKTFRSGFRLFFSRHVIRNAYSDRQCVRTILSEIFLTTRRLCLPVPYGTSTIFPKGQVSLKTSRKTSISASQVKLPAATISRTAGLGVQCGRGYELPPESHPR